MLIDVYDCARCGRFHKELKFTEFLKRVTLNNEIFEYFAICPDTEQPILMRMVGIEIKGEILETNA